MTIWKFCKSETCILDNENRCIKYIVYIILLLHLFVFIDKFTVKAKMYIKRRKFRNQQNMVGVVNTICSCPGVSCALNSKYQEAEDHIRKLLVFSTISIAYKILFFSFSTGFISILMYAVLLSILTFFVTRIKSNYTIAEKTVDGEVSLICESLYWKELFVSIIKSILALFLSSITSFLWIWRNQNLRTFSGSIIKKLYDLMSGNNHWT